MSERSENIAMFDVVGVVLSGASTRRAEAQIAYDKLASIREGELVGIKLWRSQTLAIARIDAIRVESVVQKPGSVWDELRALHPEAAAELDNLAKPTVVAELTILGLAGRRGLPPIPRPPLPGDIVVRLPEDSELVFGVRRGEPGILWYGSVYGYQSLPVPLDVEAITMHVGVFGETGSGKSYGVGYLLELLSHIPIGDGEDAPLPAIVVDANGDYLDYHEAFISGGYNLGFSKVVRFVTPRSKQATKPYTERLVVNIDEFSTREAAEIIIAYKTGGREMNEMQVAALERVFSELIEEGYSLSELLCNSIHMVYDKLEELSRGREAVIHHQTARAVRSALEKFHREVCKQHGVVGDAKTASITRVLVDEATKQGYLLIVDFSADGAPGLPLQVKQLIVAYIARLLYETFTEYKVRGEERYIVFVIEEAQNYAPNLRLYPVGISIARDYLALLATQGRKFGVSLLLVSQRPAFIDPVILSMINTWIVHRLSPEDVSYIARAAGGLPKELESRLTSLPRGVALIAGQMNLAGHPLLVKVGKRSVAHRMGLTRIVEHLRRTKRRD